MASAIAGTPSASSSFRPFIIFVVEDSVTDRDCRLTGVHVDKDDEIVEWFKIKGRSKIEKTLASWAAGPFLVSFVINDRDQDISGASGFDVSFLDIRTLTGILLPRLRDLDPETIAACLEIRVPHSKQDERNALLLARIFSRLLDLLYTLDLEVLRALARLTYGTESPLHDLFVEAEAYRLRHAFSPVDRITPDASFLTPSRNVEGSGVIGEDAWLADDGDEPDMRRIDPERIAALFDRQGLFEQTMERYERRPQQIAMARGVAMAFNDGDTLLVEAGTGTGKSLSYLVPAIHWAIENDQRIIISTNTKNLQEQLFFKDIPFLVKALHLNFRASLLKGRSNYICLDRWGQVINRPDDYLTVEEKMAALPLVTWLQETATGDVAENTGFSSMTQRGLWQKINAEGGVCSRCAFQDECFVNRARAASSQSHLVIINHSLLFSDLASDNAVLADYVHLIIDEAHNLEKAAIQHMTTEVNGWRARNLLRRLYSREGVETGLLATLKYRSERSPMKQVWKDALAAGVRMAIDRLEETDQTLETFFNGVVQDALINSADLGAGYAVKTRYTADAAFTRSLAAQTVSLLQRLIHLRDALGRLGETLHDIPASWLADREEFLNVLTSSLEGLKQCEEDLSFLSRADDENAVYWVEAPVQSHALSCLLTAAPLDVSTRLYEGLFSRMRTVILTSATLAVGAKFGYPVSRLGLRNIEPPRLKTFRIGSPFDYQNKALVCVPSDFPSPKTEAFQSAVSQLIESLALASRRGTLALFTSYGMLNRTYQELAGSLEKLGIPLMAQGISGSRTSILERFRNSKGSVLLGTDSFWEGIDVPGSALQIVVLVKLPFAVPSEPIIQAQVERLDRAGRNSFLEFLVPEAVIKFRQGFGRLIRTDEDHGVVVVLDQRVIGTRYGALFLDSLPTGHRVFRNADDLVEGVTRWFDAVDASAV